MKLLFLLKKNYSYDYPGRLASGLFNSANFVAETLERYLHHKTDIETCVDGNEVDKYVTQYRPDICFIEALWVTPEKLTELTKLHKKVKFVIRVHSKIPFLANEGIAISWILQYEKIKNVSVAFNNLETTHDFKSNNIKAFYLPNIYFDADFNRKHHNPFHKKVCSLFKAACTFHPIKKEINIGCFGAIRPMKNQLLQAMAAIAFADSEKIILNFHMNSTRIEQNGQPTLKNIRALFEHSKHKLIEHGWASHSDFLKLIKTMDIGLQLSLSESFNIVTADFVSQNVPIITSPEISWMPLITKVGPFNISKIVDKLQFTIRNKKLCTTAAAHNLEEYNLHAIKVWEKYLLHNIHNINSF